MILNPETQICANCLWLKALCYTAREMALGFRNHAMINFIGVIHVVLDDAGETMKARRVAPTLVVTTRND